MALSKLRQETAAPFLGFAELMAYDAGPFAKERIKIEEQGKADQHACE